MDSSYLLESVDNEFGLINNSPSVPATAVDPSADRFRDVVSRLEKFAGPEGFGVSLTDADTEWSLCAIAGGRMSFMNLSCEVRWYGQPRHLIRVHYNKLRGNWDCD